MNEPGAPPDIRRELATRRSRWSSWAEVVAADLGIRTERHDPRVLMLHAPGRLLAFHGLLGPSVGHAMQLFSDSVALTRLRWSQVSLPVPGYRLLSRRDVEGAWRAVDGFGGTAMLGSVVLGAGTNHIVDRTDEAGFRQAWQAAAEATGTGRTYNRLLIEPVPQGRDVRVTVVGGDVVVAREVSPAAFNQRAVASSPAQPVEEPVVLDAKVTDLVARASAALPQIPYCTIHMALEGEPSGAVSALLRHVELEPAVEEMADAAVEAIVRSVIEFELAYEP